MAGPTSLQAAGAMKLANSKCHKLESATNLKAPQTLAFIFTITFLNEEEKNKETCLNCPIINGFFLYIIG